MGGKDLHPTFLHFTSYSYAVGAKAISHTLPGTRFGDTFICWEEHLYSKTKKMAWLLSTFIKNFFCRLLAGFRAWIFGIDIDRIDGN
jgi:hypothetical protein